MLFFAFFRVLYADTIPINIVCVDKSALFCFGQFSCFTFGQFCKIRIPCADQFLYEFECKLLIGFR